MNQACSRLSIFGAEAQRTKKGQARQAVAERFDWAESDRLYMSPLLLSSAFSVALWWLFRFRALSGVSVIPETNPQQKRPAIVRALRSTRLNLLRLRGRPALSISPKGHESEAQRCQEDGTGFGYGIDAAALEGNVADTHDIIVLVEHGIT